MGVGFWIAAVAVPVLSWAIWLVLRLVKAAGRIEQQRDDERARADMQRAWGDVAARPAASANDLLKRMRDDQPAG